MDGQDLAGKLIQRSNVVIGANKCVCPVCPGAALKCKPEPSEAVLQARADPAGVWQWGGGTLHQGWGGEFSWDPACGSSLRLRGPGITKERNPQLGSSNRAEQR